MLHLFRPAASRPLNTEAWGGKAIGQLGINGAAVLDSGEGLKLMQLCFVIPVYNERDTLTPLTGGILEHTAGHSVHIVYVDDGSRDGSSEELDRIATEHSEVEVIRLRGNFGKSAALATGFAHATGDVVITMDSDLQDDPQEIPRFLEQIEAGFDVVCGWKKNRRDPWHKVWPSHAYNGFVSWLFALPIHDVNCGFKAFRSEVVKKIEVYGEMHRLIPVMAHNLNYRVGEIPVEHHKRQYGVSKFGFERFSRGAVDVLTMWFLSRYQHQPAHFFGKTGFAQCGLGLLALVVVFLGMAWGASEAFLAGMGAVGVVLVVNGVGFVGLGLLAELVLRHFVRIDPALYAEEPGNGRRDA